MRSDEEIIRQIEAIEDQDLFGFSCDALAQFLDIKALATIAAEVNPDHVPTPRDPETIKGRLAARVQIGWEEISVGRNLSTLLNANYAYAYLWMLGDDEALAFIHEIDLESHGAEMFFFFVARIYQLPVPAWFRTRYVGEYIDG